MLHFLNSTQKFLQKAVCFRITSSRDKELAFSSLETKKSSIIQFAQTDVSNRLDALHRLLRRGLLIRFKSSLRRSHKQIA